jgi:hypothetical protein
VSWNRLNRLARLLWAAAVLWGCQGSPPAAQSTPTAVPATPEITATVPAPTATLTPRPPVALLVAPGGSPLAVSLEPVLLELAASAGWQVERAEALAPGQPGEPVRLVVLADPSADAAGLAAASPQVQFLAVGIPGLQAGGNLSVLGAQGERPDQQGFLSGLIAAVVTPDWRVGVISAADTAAGRAARLGFLTGVRYFCGLCRPAFPPFEGYPLYAELPAAASPAEWQAAADFLLAKGVQTVYLAPGAGDPSLAQYLAGSGAWLIGPPGPAGSPPAGWIAAVQPEPGQALRQAWEELTAGRGGLTLAMPVGFTALDEEGFTAARQRLVAETLADLLAGLIESGADPVTGEPR